MNVPGVNASVSGVRHRAHVVVCGNGKGGTGKSTFAMHIAVALLRSGYRVATVDLDASQGSFTRYVANRVKWAQTADVDIALPDHRRIPDERHVVGSEGAAFAAFAEALAGVDATFEFVVVDTAAGDTFPGRLAHRLADTLVTPLNDSLVDLDTLGDLRPAGRRSPSGSGYALSVAQARAERRQADGGPIDWVVACNRVPVSAAGVARIAPRLDEMAGRLGFRLADGISQRVLFDELFIAGLTVFDDFDGRSPISRASLAQLAARQEMRQVMDALRLSGTSPARQSNGPHAPRSVDAAGTLAS